MRGALLLSTLAVAAAAAFWGGGGGTTAAPTPSGAPLPSSATPYPSATAVTLAALDPAVLAYIERVASSAAPPPLELDGITHLACECGGSIVPPQLMNATLAVLVAVAAYFALRAVAQAVEIVQQIMWMRESKEGSGEEASEACDDGSDAFEDGDQDEEEDDATNLGTPPPAFASSPPAQAPPLPTAASMYTYHTAAASTADLASAPVSALPFPQQSARALSLGAAVDARQPRLATARREEDAQEEQRRHRRRGAAQRSPQRRSRATHARKHTHTRHRGAARTADDDAVASAVDTGVSQSSRASAREHAGDDEDDYSTSSSESQSSSGGGSSDGASRSEDGDSRSDSYDSEADSPPRRAKSSSSAGRAAVSAQPKLRAAHTGHTRAPRRG